MLWNKNPSYSVMGMPKMQKLSVWSTEPRAVVKPSSYCGFWKKSYFSFFIFHLISIYWRTPSNFYSSSNIERIWPAFSKAKVFSLSLLSNNSLVHLNKKRHLQNRRIWRERRLIAYSPNPHFSMKRLTAWEVEEFFKW